MAVRERDGEAVVYEAVADRHLRRLTEPAAQAVTAALDAHAIRRAVLGEEEFCGGGELEEVLVEGGGEGRFVLEHETGRALDHLDVILAQTYEGHLLANESLHVRAWMRALRRAHVPVSLCDNPTT